MLEGPVTLFDLDMSAMVLDRESSGVMDLKLVIDMKVVLPST